jgi:large subunit ribosomal protein L10
MIFIITSFCFGRRRFFITKRPRRHIKGGVQLAKVELKQPIIEEIKGYAQNAKAVVLVDYRGLTVAEDTELRRKLRESGVVYKVYKNTYLNFAFKGTEFEELSKDLQGPTAVAFGIDDATAPARIINDMIKKMPKLEFKSGVVEGTYYDSKRIQVIATIPSREVLISRLLGSIQAPIANLARVLKQIAEKAA